MTTKPHTNLRGSTGGNIYYDKRLDLLWKLAGEDDVSDNAKERLKWFDHFFR